MKTILKTATGIGLALALQSYALTAQTITVGTPLSAIAFGATTTVAATASSALTVSISSLTPDVCTTTADGATVTAVGVGTCSLQADQAGDATYSAAPTVTAGLSIAFTKATQTLSGNPSTAATPTYGSSFSLNVLTGGASGNPVVFSSGSPAVCIVSGIIVFPLDGGSCVVNADQAASTYYAAATTTTHTFTINPETQTISAITGGPTVYGTTAAILATTNSPIPVIYGTSTGGVCSVNSSTGYVTPITAGTCTVTATNAGNSMWSSVAATPVDLTIALAPQTLSPINGMPTVFSTSTTTLTAPTSLSSGAGTWSTADGTQCTIVAGTGVLTIVKPGSCSVTFTSAADTKYAQSTSTATSVIAKAPQAITGWTVLGTPTFGSNFTVSATPGASSSTLAYHSTTGSVCSVILATGVVTPITAGTCTITTDQAGDANYLAAPTITNNITIALASQTISAIASTNNAPAYGGGTFTLSATATSGNTVVFNSMTPSVCTNVLGVVTPVTAGACTIAANQAGDNKYAAAPQKTRTLTIDFANQTISAITGGPTVFGTATTVAATASSGLAVTTFGSLTTGVCTVSGTTVTPVIAGTCLLTADQAGDSRYYAAPEVTTSFTIAKASQTIAPILGGPTTYNGTGAVTTSASSGLAVVLTSLTPSVCTLSGSTSGSTVTAVGVGTCTIAADQAGDSHYAAATEVLANLTIAALNQTIGTITATGTPTYGTPFTVSASGGASGNPVTFSASGTCTVSGTTVTPTASGTCTISADQAGNAHYNAAPTVSTNIVIALAANSISAITGGPSVYPTTATVGATVTSGGAITFASTTPLVCTVSGTTVTPVSGGTCTITASANADTKYTSAFYSQNFTISTESQFIGSITTATSTPTYGTGFTVTATSTSGLAPTFSSTTPTYCTVNPTSGLVTPVLSGACTIKADQAGNSQYSAASSVTNTFTIVNASQAISLFASLPATIPYSGTAQVSAYGGGSGQTVIFGSNSPLICLVSGGGVVTPKDAGTCVVTANQGAGGNYDAAPQATINVVITQASQTITWSSTTSPATPTLGTPFTISATGGGSGQPIVYTTATGSVCTVSGSTVTPVTAGTCTLHANQLGNSKYTAATQVDQSFTIAPTTQTISAITGGPTVYGTTPVQVTATISSGLTIAWASTTTGVCTIDASGNVTTVTGGSCTITANQAGNASYGAATQVSKTWTIATAAQTIGAITTVTATPTYGTPFTVTATASSGLATTFTSNTSSVCTVNPTTGVVTPVMSGTCTIVAAQAGNTSYSAASNQTQSFTIANKSQAITITDPGSQPYGSTFTISATGGSSGNAVTFASTTSLTCTATGTNGATITPIAQGTCTITANQAGVAGTYNAAPQVSQNITITLASQTIVWSSTTSPATPTYGTNFTVSATGGSSGNKLTFSAASSSVCTVVDNGNNTATVTPVDVGACTVNANQAGNTQYSAATQTVSPTFTIGQSTQTIASITGGPTVYGTPASVSTTSTSGLTIAWSTLDGTFCTVDASGLVTPVKSGSCTVYADQSGTSKYLAATEQSVVLTIAKKAQTIGAITGGPTVYGTTSTLAATATSGNTVVFTVDASTSTICSVSGVTVTPLQSGACLINANEPGDTKYAAAPQVQQSFTIAKKPQTITNIATGPSAYGVSVNVTTTASSGLSVTFTASGSCSNAGSIVTPTASGTCTIKTDQAGDSKWAAAPQISQDFTISAASQTIEAIAGGPTVYSATGSTVSTNSTSGLTITFGTTTPTICSSTGANGSLITPLKAGSCIVTADQAGNSQFAAASQVTKTLTIALAPQTIGTISAGGSTVFGTTFTVSATGGSSGNALTYASTTGAVCSVVAATGVVTPLSTGTCTITADQLGNTQYSAASTKSQNFTITKGTQTIPALTGSGSASFGTPITISATASSNLAITFTDSTPSICTVMSTDATPVNTSAFNGGTHLSSVTVRTLNTGDCIIKANRDSTANYTAAAQVTKTVTISSTPQTISAITTATGTPTYGTPFTALATATSGLPLTWASTTPLICTIDVNGVITPVAAGTCTVTADIGASNGYGAASTKTGSFTIVKANQTIAAITGGPTSYGQKVTMVDSAGSKLPIVWASLTPLVCTVSGPYGDTITAVDFGSCQLTANQAGDGRYNAAPTLISSTMTIAQGVQTITGFIPSTTTPVYGGHFTVSASGGGSGNAVTFSTTTTTICTLSGSTLTAVGIGDCIIKADQAGNVRYAAAAQLPLTVTIGPSDQTLSLTTGPSGYLDTIKLKATSTKADTATHANSFTYSTTSAASVCKISNDTVFATGTGYCAIKAIEAGDVNYVTDSVVATFTIGKRNQTLAAITVMPTIYMDTTTISTTSTSGLKVSTFSSVTPGVCTIISGTTVKVVPINVGTCTITATQAGDASTQAGSVTTSSVIGPAPQTVKPIVFAAAKYGDTVTLSTSSTSKLTAFTYLVDTATAKICHVGTTLSDLNKLYVDSVGTCNVYAIQAGNSQWAVDTSVAGTLTATARAQTIGTLTGGPAMFQDSAAISGTATSGLTITYSTTTAAICSVLVSQKVYAKTAGSCVIKADQTGDTKWQAAPTLTQTFVIGKKSQTIASITGGPSKYGDTALVSSVASSGEATTITSGSPTICSVVPSTSKVVALLPGNCILKSTQVGTANWSAAPTYTDTLTIARDTLTIKANPVFKIYGGLDTLTYIVDNSINIGDTIRKGDKLNGALVRVAGESVGLYTINQGTLTDSLNPKYHIIFSSTATMNIIRKPITVAADSQSVVYGATAKALTFRVTPTLIKGDTLKGAMTRETGDSVGTYAISQGTVDTTHNTNYAITYISRNYRITRLPITVTADTLSKIYGAAEPAKFTYKTLPALVGSDSLKGALSRATGENVGTYAVTQGTLDTILNLNYKITFVTKLFKINQKPLTVTATRKTIVYGTPDTLKYTTVGLVSPDTLKGALSRKAGTTVGSYAISMGTLANANYKITFVPDSLIIAHYPITVTPVDTTKVYGALDPKIRFTVSPALVGKDVLKGALTHAAGVNVGSYLITQGTLTDSANPSYDITVAAGHHMAITRKPITVTADTLTKIYGDHSLNTLTYKTVGLVKGETLVGSLVRHTLDTTIGVYAIDSSTINNANNPNYAITYVPHHVRVMPKPLSVVADTITYVYGNASAIDTTKLTFHATGFVSSVDSLNDTARANGWLTRPAGSAAGVYAIKRGAFADSNYKITFTSKNLIIAAHPLGVHATAHSQTYGTPDTLKYTTSGTDSTLVGADTLTGKMARKVGTSVGKYAMTLGTLANKNYKIVFFPDTLTITPRPITVRTHNKTKVYGAVDPVFTLIDTLVGKDVLKGTLSRAAGTGVTGSPYTITQGTVTDSANPNYNITFVADSTLTITPRPVTVTPKALTKVYGATDPTLTFTASGLYSTDVLSGTLTRVAGDSVKGSPYTISQGTVNNAGNPNYAITCGSAALTITPAPLKIVMGAFSKVAGASDPDFSASPTVITGLVNSDAISGSFARTAGEAVGKFAISLGSVTAGSNYKITFTTNYLTITKSLTRYMMASDGNASTINTIEGPTTVYDMKGAMVWNGNMEFGSVTSLQNALQSGRYVVKNQAAGSFIWVNQK